MLDKSEMEWDKVTNAKKMQGHGKSSHGTCQIYGTTSMCRLNEE